MITRTSELSWMFEPVSAEMYEAMPVEICRTFEVVDGMVRMNPSPVPFHKDVASEIRNRLAAAGKPFWRATTDVDLRLHEDPLLNRRPDVVVYRADAPRTQRIQVKDVLAVIEVVSPGSESTDRRDKPTEYAEAGIPYFWRVETVNEVPVVHTYTLDEATKTYVPTAIFTGIVATREPFPVEIDLTDV